MSESSPPYTHPCPGAIVGSLALKTLFEGWRRFFNLGYFPRGTSSGGGGSTTGPVTVEPVFNIGYPGAVAPPGSPPTLENQPSPFEIPVGEPVPNPETGEPEQPTIIVIPGNPPVFQLPPGLDIPWWQKFLLWIGSAYRGGSY